MGHHQHQLQVCVTVTVNNTEHRPVRETRKHARMQLATGFTGVPWYTSGSAEIVSVWPGQGLRLNSPGYRGLQVVLLKLCRPEFFNGTRDEKNLKEGKNGMWKKWKIEIEANC